MARRADEANLLAQEVYGILGSAIVGLSDDPIEQIRLLKATVWVLVGRWLGAWSLEEREQEWREAYGMVMDVARTVRKERVQ